MRARTVAPSASEDREVLRLAGPVVLWWIWLAFVAANVVDFAVQGLSSARFGAVVSAVLLFVTGLAYTLALRPRVIADASGLHVVNPFRVHHVPWRLIQSVDTWEWVRVRYAALDGAQTKTLHCWALYMSSRARRKVRRGAPAPRRGFGVFGRVSQAAEAAGGYATADSASRLPEEARNLASMPVAQAMASRLDARAAKERARRKRQAPARTPDTPTDRADGPLDQTSNAPTATSPDGPPDQTPPDQTTSTWDRPALAAAVIPAVILLIVALL